MNFNLALATLSLQVFLTTHANAAATAPVGCGGGPESACSSCGETDPGVPSVSGEDGDRGFQATFPISNGPAGSEVGSLSWQVDELAEGISLYSIDFFSFGGTSQYQSWPRWQIKSANSLVDMSEGDNELTIKWYGPGQFSQVPLNGAFETPNDEPFKVVTISLGATLQILTEDSGEPVGLVELEYDEMTRTRTWTDLLSGRRFIVSILESIASLERVITAEEWLRKSDSFTYELISRKRETYSGLGEFVLTESVVDPITADRPQGANLVTSHSYRYSFPTSIRVSTSYPDGSWISRSVREELNGRYELVGADGEIDPNFGSLDPATYFIDSVTYRPWLDSPAPGPNVVPDIDECVAEVEIRFENAITNEVMGSRRETRVLGTTTSAAETFYQDVIEAPNNVYTITSETTFGALGAVSSYSQTKTAKSGPLAGLIAGRVVETTDENGVVRKFDYSSGGFSVATGFDPTNTTGTFLQVREWDTKQIPGKSTLTSLVEDAEGKTVERKLECWNGSDWDLMVTDRWNHDAVYGGQSVTEHYTNDVLVGRSTETPTTSTTWSAGGPAVTTVNDSSYETTSMIEDYPGDTPDITTTYSRAGRKEIVTRAAGDLVETTVTERDVAGRIVSRIDERGIKTEFSYSDGGRVTSTTRPGGITETTTTYLDGQMKGVSGTGVIPAFRSYAVDETTGFLSRTTYVGTTDDTSPRWYTEVSDWSGRTVETIRPSPSGAGTFSETRHYNPTTGKLVKVVSTGMADRLSTYDEFGRNQIAGLDLDANGALDPASTDRMTETDWAYVNSEGRWWSETTTAAFHTNNNGTGAYVTNHSTALAPVSHQGSARWTTVVEQPGGLTITIHRDEYLESATIFESTDSSATTATPDTKAESVAGRLISYSEFGSDQATTFEHDAFGRQFLVTDPRGGTNRTIYNAVGQVTHQINHARNTTVIDYYPADHQSAGLQQRVSNPELESVEYCYNSRGQITEVTGSGTYPLSYGYDSFGDLHTLTTYASGGAGDSTTWIRDPATGVVLQKRYADQNGTTYTYHPTGEVHIRTWQRGDTTTYTYNAARDLTGIDYSDDTPDVILVPDRLGRPAEVTDGGGRLDRTYHDELPFLANDEYDATHAWLPGVTVERAWTAATAQRLHTGTKRGGIFDQNSDYLHDPATGRLQRITGPGFVHRYEYAPGTSLITDIKHRDSGDEMTLAREIRRTDLAGRLYGIETRGENDAVLQRHGYRHDKAGRRVRATREDGSYWAYGYNDRGEVVSANKHLPDGSPLASQQFGYDYDALGNRNWAKSGGDASGENLRSVTYDSNELNQYHSIITPGSIDVIGRAPANDTVTVNSQATLRQGDRFRAEVTADNSTSAVWQDITVSDGTPPDIEGNRYIPKATVAPEHDEDGNLLFDGRWDYTWDAENRLASMTTNPADQATGEPYRRLVFSYDWMGKRIRKEVFDSPPPATPVEDIRFAYDGWNTIAEYSVSGGTITLLRGYTWGTDLSGTEQGAGGVGGLLAVRQGGASYAASYDGNGNIVGWVNAAGELASKQEFDPFGNRIIQEGSMPPPIGFSTKYQDDETGLVYYGYRFYNPLTGKWPSRDPIGETGGANLYLNVSNDAINRIDILGLSPWLDLREPLPGSAKSALLSSLGRAKNIMSLTELHRVGSGKMAHAISELYIGVGTVAVSFDGPGLARKGADGRYVEANDEIILTPSFDVLTALHESTHAYFRDKFGSAWEEGRAYGMERLYELHEVFENDVFREIRKSNQELGDNCPRLRQIAADAWNGFTIRLDPKTFSKSYTVFGPFRRSSPMTTQDFQSIKRSRLGAFLSCKDAAKVLNDMVETKGCCIRFSCDFGVLSRKMLKENVDITVPAYIEVDEAFK